MSQITAIILSGGKSSRMNGLFKPLLTLGNKTVIERSISIFHNAGVDEILCVTGHNHHLLSDIIKNAGCREVINSRYEDGMFSSIKTGISALKLDCQAFFILPVDIPLVRTSTVQRVLETWKKENNKILYPVFNGRRGHPPLIPARYAEEVLSWDGDYGLRGFLEQYEKESMDVPVADEHMLADMDTREDYNIIKRRYEGFCVPTVGECRYLMKEVLGVKQNIISHCETVAEVAVSMGKEVNNVGGDLNLDLITAGALLHDLAREKSNHASVGADFLQDIGFPKVAEIVAVHMDISSENISDDTVSEKEVVYLADKFISGTRRVSVEERFEAGMRRFGNDPDAAKAIQNRMRDAVRTLKKIDKITKSM